MIRTDIIKQLIEKYNLKRYLEIGVATGHNFHAIECEKKFWVDPAPRLDSVEGFRGTSDEFFQYSWKTWDMVFIDGLHTHKQVAKDIENARKRLRPGGFVVLHDMLPDRKELEVPDMSGTCWRAVADLRCTDDTFHYYTVDTDHGVGVGQWKPEKVELWKDPQENWDLDYLLAHRNELMNVVKPEDWKP